MANVKTDRRRLKRISQGDVFREVQCIEYVVERRGILEVGKIVFPLVVVLTQDCDLEWDSAIRDGRHISNNDKRLFSILVAPLYNAEHVFAGGHLLDLGLSMAKINHKRNEGTTLRQNERPRYHYIDFPSDVPIVPSIVDFKHYFSLSMDYLLKVKSQQFVCRLSPLYREDLSIRFASYLTRIALPQ